MLMCNNDVLEKVGIKRVILQGDSLFPLLFSFALAPTSMFLRRENLEYRFGTDVNSCE